MITSLMKSLDANGFAPLLPYVIVVCAIVFLMIAKMVRMSQRITFSVTMFLLALAWAGVCIIAPSSRNVFGFSADHLGQLGIKLLLPAVMIISLMVLRKFAEPSKKIEALLMILISCFGAMTTLVATNWMLFFIGLQCLSLPLYGMLAFDPDDKASLSSSARYLLLSFVAMAIMLFGILLLYAATGTMQIAVQSQKLVEMAPSLNGLVSLGLIMVFAGIAFKVSLFPFHAWAPEVYSGARLFVISYLVVVVKSVVLIFLLRSSFVYLGGTHPTLTSLIGYMAIFSMWVGNGMMLRERNLIRMLAFLSIGHLGALMIPILAHNARATEAIFLDITAFGVAMLLVFTSLKGFGHDRARGINVDDLRGLYYRRPWASITLAIALISLTGFPLTAGFVGKFAIFQAGLDAQLWHLILHFVLSSILSLAVLAYLVGTMWIKSAKSETTMPPPSHALAEILFCAALAIVVMGIFPEPWIAWIKAAT